MMAFKLDGKLTQVGEIFETKFIDIEKEILLVIEGKTISNYIQTLKYFFQLNSIKEKV